MSLQTKIFRFFFLNLLAGFLLSGCMSRSTSEMISSDKLALAELNPQLRFDQEVMVVRLSQVLEEAKLSNSERADLYFERGVLYDSLGLWSLARYDFSQALSLNQKMVAAYNYMGLYLLLDDDYDSAIDAFNAVLELDSTYSYTYLNRGLSFYYSGRYSEAERDLIRFYEDEPKDPYRALWLYFNELELTPLEAKANLMKRAKIDAMAQPNSAHYAELLTETYFYLAKQKLKSNEREEAISLFRLALANQVFNFVEYRFALFELSQLRNQDALTGFQTTPAIVGE